MTKKGKKGILLYTLSENEESRSVQGAERTFLSWEQSSIVIFWTYVPAAKYFFGHEYYDVM